MSEAVNDLFSPNAEPALMTSAEKHARYLEITPFIRGVVMDDAASGLAIMSGFLSVLHNAFPYFFWTGFYRRVDTAMLEVGPNQGTMGCTKIPFAKGVCGQVAASGETMVVADVHAEPNHIGCDSLSNSEIVLPLVINGTIAGVLDVDSTLVAAFDDIDRHYLEKFMTLLGRALGTKDLMGLFKL